MSPGDHEQARAPTTAAVGKPAQTASGHQAPLTAWSRIVDPDLRRVGSSHASKPTADGEERWKAICDWG